MKLRPEVQRFAEAMEKRLRANDHKGGWCDCPLDYLITRLDEETSELLVALGKAVGFNLQRGASRIRKEAADVANFAMMIADNYGDLMAEKGLEE